MAKNESAIVVSAVVPRELYAEVREYARDNEQTLSGFVRKALRDAIERRKEAGDGR